MKVKAFHPEQQSAPRRPQPGREVICDLYEYAGPMKGIHNTQVVFVSQLDICASFFDHFVRFLYCSLWWLS
jgi:hypothetical protein